MIKKSLRIAILIGALILIGGGLVTMFPRGNPALKTYTSVWAYPYPYPAPHPSARTIYLAFIAKYDRNAKPAPTPTSTPTPLPTATPTPKPTVRVPYP